MKHDFETSTDGWTGYNRPEGAVVLLDSTTAASGKSSLRIENTGTGGDFTVWSGATPFDAMKLGKLHFAYNTPPEVKINLYLQIGSSYYVLEFTGGPQPAGICPSLGKIEDVQSDSRWHVADFDLAKALRKALPGQNPLIVDRLCFSAPRNTYYFAGLGGNGWGSKWYLDDFELTP